MLLNGDVNIPQSGVCAFHPHILHLHKACLEHETAVSTVQTQRHINDWLKSEFKTFSYVARCCYS